MVICTKKNKINKYRRSFESSFMCVLLSLVFFPFNFFYLYFLFVSVAAIIARQKKREYFLWTNNGRLQNNEKPAAKFIQKRENYKLRDANYNTVDLAGIAYVIECHNVLFKWIAVAPRNIPQWTALPNENILTTTKK